MDYIALNTTIAFSAGFDVGTLQCIVITIRDDGFLENTEEFIIRLASLSRSIEIDPEFATATVNIIDNECM